MGASKETAAALMSHRKWKERLKQAIETGKSEYTATWLKQDNTGDFGAWLYEKISPEDKQSPHFQVAKEIHAKFHLEAAQVLELALAGRKQEATIALGPDGAFGKIAMALDSELIAWYVDATKAVTAGDKTASADKMQAILEARRKAMAQTTEMQTGESMPLVVFSLSNEKYGVATEYVREIQPLGDVTPVPCTPDFVVGVINVRGAIYSVIDIRGFFGVPKQSITDATKVLLISGAGLELGILADNVKGATSVLVKDIKPPLAAQAVAKEEYIQGVTKEMLVVLNLEALLRDERIIVREEVG